MVDGVYYSGISSANLNRLGLVSDEEYDTDFLNREVIEVEKREALAYMLTVLKNSNATVAELVRKAKQKAFCMPAVTYAVSRLEDMHFVDDARYAAGYADRQSGRLGKRRIAFELKNKGVAAQQIEEAVSSIEDETETALTVARKRLGSKTLDQKEKEKLTRFLLYRGFGFDTVKKVLRTLGAELDEEQ